MYYTVPYTDVLWKTKEMYGYVDIMVNNAGINEEGLKTVLVNLVGLQENTNRRASYNAHVQVVYSGSFPGVGWGYFKKNESLHCRIGVFCCSTASFRARDTLSS